MWSYQFFCLFPFRLTIRIEKRIQHQVYIEKACPVCNQDLFKHCTKKGSMYRKVQGMLTRLELHWMKVVRPRQNAPLT